MDGQFEVFIVRLACKQIIDYSVKSSGIIHNEKYNTYILSRIKVGNAIEISIFRIDVAFIKPSLFTLNYI